jgi:hypothetical protein
VAPGGAVGVGSESEAVHWAAEFARTGEVRIPPRRWVTGLKTLSFGFLLANLAGAVVTAALGRQDWLWWPLIALLCIPAWTALVWTNASAFLLGRPVLTIDRTGVSLGRKRLAWEDVETVNPPSSLRNRPSDPRKPVDESRGWFDLVTIAPTLQDRKPQIAVGKNHVKDLEALTAWLNAVHQEHQPGNQAA